MALGRCAATSQARLRVPKELTGFHRDPVNSGIHTQYQKNGLKNQLDGRREKHEQAQGVQAQGMLCEARTRFLCPRLYSPP